jgi:hypothetical protein
MPLCTQQHHKTTNSVMIEINRVSDNDDDNRSEWNVEVTISISAAPGHGLDRAAHDVVASHSGF